MYVLEVIGKRASSSAKSPQMTVSAKGEALRIGVVLAVVQDGDAHAQDRPDLAHGAADVAAPHHQQHGGRLHHLQHDLHHGGRRLHRAAPFQPLPAWRKGVCLHRVVRDGRACGFADGGFKGAATQPAQDAPVGVDEHLPAGAQRPSAGPVRRRDHGATHDGRPLAAGAQDLLRHPALGALGALGVRAHGDPSIVAAPWDRKGPPQGFVAAAGSAG